MRGFTFSDEDLKAIDHDRYHHPHPHVQRKMEVLWLKSHGLPHQWIADLAGVSLRTVQRYLDEYLEGGLKQVRRCKWRGPKTALLQHERSVEEYFWDHPPRGANEAAMLIFEQTGVWRGLTQVRSFLKAHLGLRYRKVAAIPVPPKKTVEEHAQEQARFLAQELEPRLREARAGSRAVFFVDAAHFVWAPFLGYLWCLTRLFVRSATGRKRYSELGALKAVTHDVIRVGRGTSRRTRSVRCCVAWRVSARGRPSRLSWTTPATSGATSCNRWRDRWAFIYCSCPRTRRT